DSRGRLSAYSQGGNTNVFEYESSGNLQKTTNARNESINYTYDSVGRVTSILSGLGITKSFTYDSDGNVTNITTGNGISHLFTFGSNGEIQTYAPPSVVNGARKDTIYQYNLDKQLTKITRPDLQTVDLVYAADSD